jgi:hypothetical protein
MQLCLTPHPPYRTLTKDGMLLYKHSARCPAAMQLFLDWNPRYWPLVPMTMADARVDNDTFILPDGIPLDPTSHQITSTGTRSDHEAGTFMNDLPRPPSPAYTFSDRQCAEQFQFFKHEQDLRQPNDLLDLYDATIVAVRKYFSLETGHLI